MSKTIILSVERFVPDSWSGANRVLKFSDSDPFFLCFLRLVGLEMKLSKYDVGVVIKMKDPVLEARAEENRQILTDHTVVSPDRVWRSFSTVLLSHAAADKQIRKFFPEVAFLDPDSAVVPSRHLSSWIISPADDDDKNYLFITSLVLLAFGKKSISPDALLELALQCDTFNTIRNILTSFGKSSGENNSDLLEDPVEVRFAKFVGWMWLLCTCQPELARFVLSSSVSMGVLLLNLTKLW